MTGRYRQLTRCLRLIEALRGRSVTPPQLAALAADLGVSERTIRRDLAAIAAAGVPVPPFREQDIARAEPFRLRA